MSNKLTKREMKACSHIFPLVRAFEQSEGDVLELGTGYFSTLLLHWMCTMTGRKLISYDTEEKWAKKAQETWANDNHEIYHIKDLDSVNITDRHWGLVFIDHAPSIRRQIDTLRLKDHADFLVLHDTEPREDKRYRYSEVYKYFKYVYRYTKHFPHTAVISNFKEFKP